MHFEPSRRRNIVSRRVSVCSSSYSLETLARSTLHHFLVRSVVCTRGRRTFEEAWGCRDGLLLHRISRHSRRHFASGFDNLSTTDSHPLLLLSVFGGGIYATCLGTERRQLTVIEQHLGFYCRKVYLQT